MRTTGIADIDRAVEANYGRLSAGQRRAIDLLLGDARYGAVVTAPQLALAADVSESTVTRAAQALGFAGYPDLQRHLRERFVAPVAARIADLPADGIDHAAVQAMREDAAHIAAMAADFPTAAFDMAVARIVAARRVLVFGERGSSGLSTILAIGLRLLRPHVHVISQAAGDLPDQLIGLDEGDLVIVISFRRVDRVSVEILRRAREVGAGTLAIADHRSSAVARTAEASLIVQIGTLRLMPSFAPGASLINALLEAVAASLHDTATDRLREAEDLWDRFRSYADT